MVKRLSACVPFAVAAVSGVAIATASPGSGYEPVLHASGFVSVVTNRYYPLPVGRTWVYRGVKDGQSQIDTVRVLARTKLVEGGSGHGS